MDPVAAVEEWQRPKDASEIRSFLFLGLAYRREGFSTLLYHSPPPYLPHPEEKNKPFEWTEACERRELKERLTTAPILALPTADGMGSSRYTQTLQGQGWAVY